jgi:hypothetical protein
MAISTRDPGEDWHSRASEFEQLDPSRFDDQWPDEFLGDAYEEPVPDSTMAVDAGGYPSLTADDGSCPSSIAIEKQDVEEPQDFPGGTCTSLASSTSSASSMSSASSGSSASWASCISESIEVAITKALPRKGIEDEEAIERAVFRLCRCLKSIQGFDFPPKELREILRRWQSMAGLNNVSFDDLWGHLATGIDRVKVPLGSILQPIQNLARADQPESDVANLYTDEGFILLAKLCRRLQEHFSRSVPRCSGACAVSTVVDPFFLTSEVVGVNSG